MTLAADDRARFARAFRAAIHAPRPSCALSQDERDQKRDQVVYLMATASDVELDVFHRAAVGIWGLP